MMFRTHLSTSMLAGIGVAKLLSLPLSIPFYAGVALGAGLPDIDHPNSFIGKKSLGIAYLINKVFGHRGITHSLPTAAVIGGMAYYFFPLPFTLGAITGYVVHLAGDFFSRSGIPVWAPLSDKRYRGPITYKTGSMTENFLLVLSTLGITYCIAVA